MNALFILVLVGKGINYILTAEDEPNSDAKSIMRESKEACVATLLFL